MDFYFNESISDVQLGINGLMKITYALINGQDEFIKSITLINDFLEEERNKIDDQYALDQIIQEETTVDSIFDQIDVYEEDEEELSASIHGWLKSCLQFKLVGNSKEVFQYKWDANTLLPPKPWAYWFQNGLSTQHTL